MFLPTSHHLVGLLELLHARVGRGGGEEGWRSPKKRGEEEQAEVAAGMRGGGSSGKKRGRAATGAAVDLSAVAGLGREELRLGAVQAAVSRGAAGLIAREAVCYRWSAGLPELCASTGARLGRLLDGGGSPTAEGGAGAGAGRSRARVRALQASLEKAAAEAVARRARGSRHPGEAGPVDTFRGMVRGAIFGGGVNRLLVAA